MFNLGDLMEMFEGNDNEQNRNRRPMKGQPQNTSPFAFGRDDDDDDHDDRYTRGQRGGNRRRDNDDDGPLSGLFD